MSSENETFGGVHPAAAVTGEGLPHALCPEHGGLAGVHASSLAYHPAFFNFLPVILNLTPSDQNILPAVLNRMPSDLNLMPFNLNGTPSDQNPLHSVLNIMPSDLNLMPAVLNGTHGILNLSPAGLDGYGRGGSQGQGTPIRPGDMDGRRG